MIYYAPGATHAPHHPTPEWIKKISDMHLFDEGFEAVREQIFANQKKLGVIPPNAKLTAWPKDLLRSGTSTRRKRRSCSIKQADVYARLSRLRRPRDRSRRAGGAGHGQARQHDHHLHQRRQRRLGRGLGDGHLERGSAVQRHQSDRCRKHAVLRRWGSNQTYPHYSIAWAWTFDTPFKWTKQIASYFGGTKNGMAVSWPATIKDKGGIRWQFHHVIDIVPTLLEIAGIPAPVQVDGVAQKPIEGVSLAYTFDDDAGGFDAPSRHRTSVFRDAGRATGLYNDGWMLSAVPLRAPWDLAGAAIADPATAYRPRALRAQERLDAVHRRRRQAPREGAGDAGPDVRRVRQVSGAAAGRLGGDAVRRTASQPGRRDGRCSTTRG